MPFEPATAGRKIWWHSCPTSLFLRRSYEFRMIFWCLLIFTDIIWS